MTPEERKGLAFVQCDSYEGGWETWTRGSRRSFASGGGYDIRPWLPALAGRVIGDAQRSERFQRDYRLTISDLYADNHYAKHTALAKANGLRFYSEAAGPHQHQADLLKSVSRCDVSWASSGCPARTGAWATPTGSWRATRPRPPTATA